MKKLLSLLKKHPHIAVIAAAAVITLVVNFLGGPFGFGIPFWCYFLFVAVYGIVIYLVKLPDSAGSTAHILSQITKKYDPFDKLFAWAYDHGCKVPAVLAGYAHAQLVRSNFDRALDVHERFMAIPAEDVPPMILKYGRQNYALSLWKCGRPREGMEVMEKMHEDYEVFSNDFFVTLGYLCIEAREWDKAREANELSLKEEGSHAQAYCNFGQIAYYNGDRDGARANFCHALELDPAGVTAKYFLGTMAEEDGDTEAAEIFFRQAAKTELTGLHVITPEMMREKKEKYGLE